MITWSRLGAPHFSDGQSEEGGAFLYQGSAAGLALTADWTAQSDQAGAFFGGIAGQAGDVNGDGFDDVIVGADEYNNGQVDEGRTYTYRGSIAGLTSTARTAEANQANANFGGSVGTAGDVNGDGFDDVIVGAGHYDHGQLDEGMAFAFYGGGG